jgi:hypothetical protein
MSYPTTPRTILRKRYPHLHEQTGQMHGHGGVGGGVGGEFNDTSAASIHLHLNTRLSYVLGQSRAAPHRRVSNVIHRYGCCLAKPFRVCVKSTPSLSCRSSLGRPPRPTLST